VVPRVTSLDERLRSVKALRPSFPLPGQILSFAWPRAVDALEASGVAAAVAARMRRLGPASAADALGRALDELRAEERLVVHAAIRGGEGFQTLWERGA